MLRASARVLAPRARFAPRHLATSAQDAKAKTEAKSDEKDEKIEDAPSAGLFDEIRRVVKKESESNDSLKASLEELEATRCVRRAPHLSSRAIRADARHVRGGAECVHSQARCRCARRRGARIARGRAR